MSRLPRYRSRVKPPLRGRAATKAPLGGTFAPIQSVRYPTRPRGAGAHRPPAYPDVEQPVSPKPEVPVSPSPRPPHSDTPNLYRHWGRFLRSLDQPWKWLLVAVIVLSSLLLLNQLL